MQALRKWSSLQIAAVVAPSLAVQWQRRMEQGAAVLTMPGWAMYNSRWDWKTWLHARLDEFAADESARGLIVDLRDNEGGLDCGDDILARYTHKPLAFSEFRRSVRFRQTPPKLNPFLDTWDDSFRKIGENASELTADDHHAGDVSLLELGSRSQRIEPRSPRFTVPLRVLTSAQNSSATFGFATRMRAAYLGKTVGQTTGGNQRGIHGGAFFFVRLPSTGLSFDLPLIGYYPYEAKPDDGLPPDIAAAPSVAAIAIGQDLVLRAALNSL